MLTSPKLDANEKLQTSNSSPVRKLRVVALVNNPCVVDARVIREATALVSPGHDVHVFAHQAKGLPTDERVDGVRYHRFAVRRRQASAEKPKGQDAQATRSGPVFEVIRRLKLVLGFLLKMVMLFFYWTTPRIVEVFYKYIVKFCKKIFKIFKKLSKIILKYFYSLLDRVGRYIITTTGMELLRHARAYYRPAIALNPDVVHAHDLYTLLAGYRVARKTGAKLVYDSHELEVGRNGNFSPWELWLRARTERWLIEKADAVITVCDSIADYLVGLYGIERPTVIHNAPSVRSAKKGAPDVRSQLKLPKRTPIALYVGSVTINRGLEHCVQSLPYTNGVHLVCVGPRHKATEELILNEAAELGVADRLHLVDPVPHDEVTAFVRTSDVSLITIQDVCLSYRFCFPNKLLESLLTRLPIVVSRLVELELIVEKTGAGVVVDQTDPKDIARGINEILEARNKFVPTPETVRELKRTYGLEVQMQKLVTLYDRLATPGSNH